MNEIKYYHPYLSLFHKKSQYILWTPAQRYAHNTELSQLKPTKHMKAGLSSAYDQGKAIGERRTSNSTRMKLALPDVRKNLNVASRLHLP